MTRQVKVSPPQRRHLEALPYSVSWWGGKPHSRPFPGFNTATHDRLYARGWMQRTGGDGRGTARYEITQTGRRALQLCRRPSDDCCMGAGCSNPEVCDAHGKPCGYPGTVEEWRGGQ